MLSTTLKFSCPPRDLELYQIGKEMSLGDTVFEIAGASYYYHFVDWCTVELQLWEKRVKTPEQILAAERVTHFRTIMEAAKKDMEYWEKKL